MPDDRFIFLRRLFEHRLSENQIVAVAIKDHVLLKMPERFHPRGDARPIFHYGLNLPVPIPDLKITDVGIEATLSFDRVPSLTFVPWEAVIWIGTPFQDHPETSPKPSRPKLTLVP